MAVWPFRKKFEGITIIEKTIKDFDKATSRPPIGNRLYLKRGILPEYKENLLKFVIDLKRGDIAKDIRLLQKYGDQTGKHARALDNVAKELEKEQAWKIKKGEYLSPNWKSKRLSALLFFEESTIEYCKKKFEIEINTLYKIIDDYLFHFSAIWSHPDYKFPLRKGLRDQEFRYIKHFDEEISYTKDLLKTLRKYIIRFVKLENEVNRELKKSGISTDELYKKY